MIAWLFGDTDTLPNWTPQRAQRAEREMLRREGMVVEPHWLWSRPAQERERLAHIRAVEQLAEADTGPARQEGVGQTVMVSVKAKALRVGDLMAVVTEVTNEPVPRVVEIDEIDPPGYGSTRYGVEIKGRLESFPFKPNDRVVVFR